MQPEAFLHDLCPVSSNHPPGPISATHRRLTELLLLVRLQAKHAMEAVGVSYACICPDLLG